MENSTPLKKQFQSIKKILEKADKPAKRLLLCASRFSKWSGNRLLEGGRLAARAFLRFLSIWACLVKHLLVSAGRFLRFSAIQLAAFGKLHLRAAGRLVVSFARLEKRFLEQFGHLAFFVLKQLAMYARLHLRAITGLIRILAVLESHLAAHAWWFVKAVFKSAWRLFLITNDLNRIFDRLVASLFLSLFLSFYRFVDGVSIAIARSVRWTIRLLKRWKKERFTFVLVPHEDSQVKKVAFSKLAVYSGAFGLSFTALFLLVSSLVLFNINEDLSNELFASREKITNLTAINQSNEEEIEKLSKNAVVVSEKLSELNVLENKIRDMVGLKTETSPLAFDESSMPLSRSADRTSILSAESTLYVPENENEILSLIENEREIIDKFSKDLEERLDFLDSRPDRMPTVGRLTSPFGFRIHPITGRRDYHKGIDLANKQGTTIRSAGSGVVTYVGYNGGYGRMVIVSHGYGYKTIYAHLKSTSVKLGDEVEKGDPIALMGNTGVSTAPHLHFEIHYNGKQINPLNILEK